jgi:hypothetical protein
MTRKDHPIVADFKRAMKRAKPEAKSPKGKPPQRYADPIFEPAKKPADWSKDPK